MDFYRFYIPGLPQAQGAAQLPEDQAHHARQVLRLEAGSPVILFDGKGGWVRAILDRVGKSGVWASFTDPVTVDPRPAVQLTLMTAVPKGERAEWLIEQASQLGVAAVQWLESDRSVVKPREGGSKMEKWRRLAVESAKQCHRTYLMEVHDARPLSALLPTTVTAGTMTLWLDPDPASQAAGKVLAESAATRVNSLVGPEGGWSPAERALLEQAAKDGLLQRVHLTETVLRIETACAAIAAIVMSG